MRQFPMMDVVGAVLSRTMQPDEASCMANCCSVVECVAYSFSHGLLGQDLPDVALSVTTSGVDASTATSVSAWGDQHSRCSANWASSAGYFTYSGIGGSNFELGISLGAVEPAAAFYDGGGWSTIYPCRHSARVRSTGTISGQRTRTAPCVLLTNVSYLVPSNLQRGSIKLSALGN